MHRPALLALPVRSTLDPRAPEFQQNRHDMLKRIGEIDALLDEAALGGGAYHHERLAKRGKLPVRERIALALDPDSPFLELSSLAAYNSSYTILIWCLTEKAGSEGTDRTGSASVGSRPTSTGSCSGRGAGGRILSAAF